MIPRWSTLLATAALVAGSMMAAAGSSATAATMHPGVMHLRPGGVLHGFKPGGPLQPTGALARHHGIRNQDESTNWSGFAATGSNGSFNSVSSNWTQPSATCNDGGDEFASFWVGLDGFNSSSVEQTGTDSDCSGGSPDYFGWFEMFPAAPVNFSNPVAPGDSMSASVTVSGDTYTLTLTDNSQGWTQTENETESGLADSSAEVITEAPSDQFGPLPLADFGTVNFSGSTANGSSMSAFSPTQIIMVGSSGDQLDSTSGMDGSGGFSNSWLAQS